MFSHRLEPHGRVKIFLSYPSQERPLAERLNLALVALGHDVFFDRADLAPGLEYNQAIARAIGDADLLVFFITPDSVTAGRYTLTELGLAERRWPHPDGRVLPVMVQPTDRAALPAYVRAVTIFKPRGDLVAELAQEADRLVRSRRLAARIRRRLRSPAGLVALGGLAAAAAVAWVVRPWEIAMLGGAARLPADVRQHARGVAPMTDSGFVVATANPARLVRFTESGAQVGEPLELMGEPVSVARDPEHILVVTRAPDGVMVLDAKRLRVVDSALLDPTLVRQPRGMTDPPRRSGDIRSVTAARGTLWVTTGDRDGEPTILRYLPYERVWDVATFSADTSGFGRDAMGVRLRTIKGDVWGAATRATPSSLYHLAGFIRVDRFDGRDLALVSCAHDVAASPAGNPIVLSCDNELQEVYAEGRELRLVRARPTLPSERGPGRSTHDLLAADGGTVVVALNTETGTPDGRPARARVAEVDSGGAVTTLLDEQGAVVRSMAVTPRSVVVVLARADGSADAVVVRRRGARGRSR